MYLIHFYSKNNIKMLIPKSWILKFQNRIKHSLYIATWWNKLCWQEKSFSVACQSLIFKNEQLKILILYIM